MVARGVPPAQVALAWLAQKPGITSPTLGASKPNHIEDRRGCAVARAGRHRDRRAGSSVRAARAGGVPSQPS
jgi:aryl-alcohol dehydrogenase-like predicted oxidoreductase